MHNWPEVVASKVRRANEGGDHLSGDIGDIVDIEASFRMRALVEAQ
jgi:hypothetical protein